MPCMYEPCAMMQRARRGMLWDARRRARGEPALVPHPRAHRALAPTPPTARGAPPHRHPPSRAASHGGPCSDTASAAAPLGPRGQRARSEPARKMMGLSDNAKVGILLIALGFLFLSLGVLLFFDAGLMAIGASCLLSHLPPRRSPGLPSARSAVSPSSRMSAAAVGARAPRTQPRAATSARARVDGARRGLG